MEKCDIEIKMWSLFGDKTEVIQNRGYSKIPAKFAMRTIGYFDKPAQNFTSIC